MIQENVRILLVEDDGDDYVITKSLLSEIKGSQIHLDWAKNFDTALGLMASNQHDAYLVDYHLGARNGIELLRLALERGCQAPIILLTGQGEHEIDLAAMQAGAADYLVKTQLAADDLERSIRYALERTRAAAIAAYEHARLAAFGAEIGLALGQKESMQATLKHCAELMLRYLNASRAEISVYNKEQDALEVRATVGASPASTVPGQSAIKPPMMSSLMQGKPVLIRGIAADKRFSGQPHLKDEGATCYAAYPLVLEDRFIGLMSMFSQAALADSVLTEMASVANGIALCIERHRSKDALDASEVKYRTVVENIKEVIFQMDEFGHWTFLNPAWEEMTGFKLSETLGTLFTQYIHADDREKNRHVFIKLVERKLDYSRHEVRYLTKDGQIRWVEAYIQPLLDREAMILGVAGTLTDITERKQTEVQIQKLAAFPRFNPNPVLEFAADGKLTYANDAAAEMTKSLGKDDPSSILPANAGEIAEECLACGQNKLRAETVINGKTISWSFFPIVASKVVHCYGVDITERLSLEAQFRHAQKLESVGQLAAGIAHDFNNILTVIQGHADLILAHAGNSETTTGQLKQISSAAQRAASLTRQLLMFSRKQIIQTRLIDLNTVLRSMAKMLPRLLGENITLNISCGEGTFRIEADVGMIEQVVMNLAVNARDAMPKGGKLSLSTNQIEIDEAAKSNNPDSRVGRFVCLTVTDNGCGMSRETLGRIFEPFFTTKEVGKGTGLGLATAFGIVKQHQGWIEVASEPNVGTTFKVFVPASSKWEAVHEEAGEQTAVRRGHNETILVVEDEPALRSMVKDTLKDYGYQVLQAAHGVEALEVYDAHDDSIDLILTDIVMPEGMTGFELGHRIKARNPEIKIIYTSGYNAGILGSEIALADQTFLTKPYSLLQLSKVVRESLDK